MYLNQSVLAAFSDEFCPVFHGVTSGSADHTGIARGPVNKDGLAVDEGTVDGAEISAVRGDGAVVAHDEVVVRGKDYLVHGAVVSVLGRHVGLGNELAVHEHAAMFNAKAIAGQRDDALDVALFRIARIVKDHNIAAIDGSEAVNEFVDEEPVAVLEARQHAGAFYPDRLIEEGDDEDGSDGGNSQIADPEQDARGFPTRGRRLLRGGR